MGFWKKLFGGSNMPDKDSTVGVDPTTNETMRKHHKAADISQSHGAKYSGRAEETKAQKQADPETRDIIKEAEEYPNTTQPRSDVDASAAAGHNKPRKSKEEQLQTQPKPASEQSETPKEGRPDTPKPEAGQHKRADD